MSNHDDRMSELAEASAAEYAEQSQMNDNDITKHEWSHDSFEDITAVGYLDSTTKEPVTIEILADNDILVDINRADAIAIAAFFKLGNLE